MMFKTGDRVYVNDPALLQLRDLMRAYGRVDPGPNNIGTVDSVSEEDGVFTVYVNFDSEEGEGMGSCAPYNITEVCRFKGNGEVLS